MSIAEIKKEIIDRINGTTDAELLEDLANIMLLHKSNSKPYPLTEQQVITVNERIEEMKKGKRISNDEADKETDEWLEK